jgi:hypothetical protein
VEEETQLILRYVVCELSQRNDTILAQCSTSNGFELINAKNANVPMLKPIKIVNIFINSF